VSSFDWSSLFSKLVNFMYKSIFLCWHTLLFVLFWVTCEGDLQYHFECRVVLEWWCLCDEEETRWERFESAWSVCSVYTLSGMYHFVLEPLDVIYWRVAWPEIDFESPSALVIDSQIPGPIIHESCFPNATCSRRVGLCCVVRVTRSLMRGFRVRRWG
jgi:hypothetical protein